jgi:hypothetical protein
VAKVQSTMKIKLGIQYETKSVQPVAGILDIQTYQNDLEFGSSNTNNQISFEKKEMQECWLVETVRALNLIFYCNSYLKQ